MTSVRNQRGQPRNSGWHGVIGLAALLAAVLRIAGLAEPAFAQNAPAGILAPGNAVVTGFSGAIPPAQIAPGVDPGEKTFIDLNGPSLRINDLQSLNGPPIAQLVAAPKPFTATAAQIGQVFSVTLDNNVPPNIYAAATSVYGVPLVAAGPDGQPIHVKRGAPNVNFMPGLWGPASLHGGPGAIWKLDGLTGAVSLFAYVTLDGAPTSAAALGGIAYHQESNSIFTVVRDTGLIQRFTVGAVRGRYDHGVQGRQAQGLSPVPYDATKRSNIKSPQFDSENPNTWGFAPPERRIFGIGIYRDRLYYAVADGLQIWSVGISPDGSFGNDATVEINVPPGSGPTEISKITFDEQGRMYLAERPDPTGAYDFEALAQEGAGRVLRYALVESYPGAPRVWQPIPDEYALGFPPPNYRNGDGGAAIGYSYDEAGLLDRSTCGGFLWSTGTRLRKSADPALATRLKLLGPENVDGLQGNAIDLVLPQNAPPLASYFIDFDDRFDDDAARGHTGDVAIWRVCGPVLRGGWMLPGWIGGGGGSLWFPPPHKQQCPPDQKKPGFQCCPKGSSPDSRSLQGLVSEWGDGSAEREFLRAWVRSDQLRSERSEQAEMHRRRQARPGQGHRRMRASFTAVERAGLPGWLGETECSRLRKHLRADAAAKQVRPRRAGQLHRQQVSCALRRRHCMAHHAMLCAGIGGQQHRAVLSGRLEAQSENRRMLVATIAATDFMPARSGQQG